MSEPCPRLWELEPYREGRLGEADARSFERHLRVCEACTAERRRDEHLTELARALPQKEPTELELRRLRTRVLRDAAAGIVPPAVAVRRWSAAVASLGVVAGLAIVGGGLLALRATPREETAIVVAPRVPAPSPSEVPTGSPVEAFAGAVVPPGTARWSQSRAEGVERVVLDEGVLRIHVRPQRVGERFLVAVPDGELEVRGTTFEVGVEAGATTRVHVDEGVVEVRLRDRGTRRLAANETWVLGGPTASAPPGHPAASSPAPAPSASAVESESAAAYATAMRLLGEGRNDEAASAFHAFAASQPGAPQAEDASFLEAVALARMGRGDAAALAAEHHLARFPASFHKREASILVARAAVRRGECDKARALLGPWLAPSPDHDAQATLGPCDAR